MAIPHLYFEPKKLFIKAHATREMPLSRLFLLHY